MYRIEVKNFNPIHFFGCKKLLIFYTKGVRGICPLQANFHKFLFRKTCENFACGRPQAVLAILAVYIRRQCLLFVHMS